MQSKVGSELLKIGNRYFTREELEFTNMAVLQDMVDKEIEPFISQVEKDAYKRGKNEADEWWNNKDDEEYEKAEEAHRTAEGYCCACGYDMAVMEGKIKQAIEKTNKRWREKCEKLKKKPLFTERNKVGDWGRSKLVRECYNWALSDLLEEKK